VSTAFGSAGTPASRKIQDGKSKTCGHRACAGVLGNTPGWTSLHPPPAVETRHFGGDVRSALVLSCTALTKAHAGQGIMCRPVLSSSEPLRCLGGQARYLLHHNVYIYIMMMIAFIITLGEIM